MRSKIKSSQMKIGILKTDQVRPEWVKEFGEYPDMFAQLLSRIDPALEFIIYDVQKNEYPQDLDEVDAYLITGSRFSVYDEVAWIKDLGTFVQTLYHARKKIIGICFGHQLVAHFLGGKTAASDKGWGIGIKTMQMTEAGQTFAPTQKTFNLIYSHRDQVIIPPTGSEILAGSDFCPIGMFKIDNHVLTVQGHPEFSEAYGRNLIGSREHLYEAELFDKAMTSLDNDRNDCLVIARWIIDFIRT